MTDSCLEKDYFCYESTIQEPHINKDINKRKSKDEQVETGKCFRNGFLMVPANELQAVSLYNGCWEDLSPKE